MKARRSDRRGLALPELIKVSTIAVILVLLTTGTAAAQFNCFPSCDETDGRLLAIAGTAQITLSDPVLELELSVPAGTTSFEIGIFDGDGAINVGPQDRWDTGVEAPYEYTLFADPLANGQGTTIIPLDSDFPVSITGSQMINADWCCDDVAAAATPGTPGNFVIPTSPAAQAPSGNFFYRLRIELTNPAVGSHVNGFKIRTSGIVTIETSEQPFSYIANFGGGAVPPDDIVLLFPDLLPDLSNVNDPAVREGSTYDGRFDFFFEVDTVDTELTVWDGDFDFGRFGGDRACTPQPACLIADDQDIDDTDTPVAIPPFATADANAEGVAVGTTTGAVTTTGAPEDDLNPATFLFNLRVRNPSVRWDLFTPDGQVFANDNPSGNQEWERFTLSTDPFDATTMDVSVPSIPLGTYRMGVEGVDMQNLNAILLPFRALCVDVFGAACETLKPYLVGDTVFRDDNGNGLQDGGEPGIGGVIVNLLDANGNVIESTATDGSGNYSFEVESGGTDVNGDPIGREYGVEVVQANFTGPTATAGIVGDLVWIDEDLNGSQGAPALEPGIPNVVVRLFEAGGDTAPGGGDDTFIGTTVTDSNGRYLFDDGLPAGNYFVVVDDSTLPEGLSLVSGTSPSTPTGEIPPASLTHDFGYANTSVTTANVGDRVWSDADGDGVQDPGEPGIGGVTLDLVEDPGGAATVAATVTTDSSGFYLFADVPAAGLGTSYAVVVTDTGGELAPYDQTGDPDEAGTCVTCDGSQTVTLFPGDHISTVDFGYQNDPGSLVLHSIADRTWFDADHDGIQDVGEPGIDGVTVSLIGFGGKLIATTTTSGGGDFSFTGLPDGDYTILITDIDSVLSAYLQTTPAAVAGSLGVEIDGADVTNVSFGYNDAGALAGLVGTTDADAKPPGNNATVVTTELQTGDAPVPDGAGGFGNNLDFDYGYAEAASIGDRVWLDVNGDGDDEGGGEPGIENVTVRLLDGSGNPVLDELGDPITDVTDSDGRYLFENLPPGDYQVEIDGSTLPSGLIQTFEKDGSLDGNTPQSVNAGEDVVDVDFGYQPENGSIGDRVWNDVDGDGVQDAGEVGINDVTVTLLDSGGGVVGVDVTEGDGDYGFDNLPPGTYTVVIDGSTLPGGFVQTFDIESPLDNEATVILGGGEDRDDVDFGYADECLTDIDFESDAAGAALHKGQIIDDEWASLGVMVSTDDPVNHPAMIFDSSNPTGGDYDLGTPNETFSGPGIGSGGEAGEAGQNAVSLGKVLIISEDGDSSDPDDDASGGTLRFDFAYPVRLDSVGILDIDEGLAGTVAAFDGGGSLIGTAAMANSLGNNSVQRVALGVSGVRSLEVYFPGSGAVSGLAFCVDCTPIRVRDDLSWDSFSNNDGPDSWAGDWIENDPEYGGAGPSAGQVQVHDGFLTLDDYPNTGGEPSAAREVDLSGAASASLSFKFLTSSDVDTDDAVTVEISNDGGGTWTTLEVLTGIYGAVQETRDYDISAFISSETQVRFRVSNKYGGYNELFCVTWIEIETDCGGCQGATVADDFIAESFSNNDGPNDWVGDWIENDPEKNGAGPWYGQVRVASGYLKLDDYPNTGGYPSAARAVDLTGAASATLSFGFRTTSGVDTSDAVAVEVSSDGGATWTVLETITGIYGSTTGSRTFDISAHASSDTQIRFRVSRYYGGSSEVFKVDWVQVESDCDGGSIASVR